MLKGLTRRDFIKTMSLGALAVTSPVEVFAAGTPADFVVSTVKKARDTGAKAVYGMGWEFQTFKDNADAPTARRDL